MTEIETKPGKIYTLIPKIMGDIGAIGKDQKNKMQNYKFRGIDDIYNAVQPSLITHGVFVVPEVLETTTKDRLSTKGGTLIYVMHKVRYTFYADDGSYFEAIVSGEAMDSGDKASNKAMSAAMKYALLQVFCIPTEGDNDTENNSPEVDGQKPADKRPEAKMGYLREDTTVVWLKGHPNAQAAIAAMEVSYRLTHEGHAHITSLFEGQQQ